MVVLYSIKLPVTFHGPETLLNMDFAVHGPEKQRITEGAVHGPETQLIVEVAVYGPETQFKIIKFNDCIHTLCLIFLNFFHFS